jgi:hypothetical protein
MDAHLRTAQRLRSTGATKTTGRRTALLPHGNDKYRRTSNRTPPPTNRHSKKPPDNGPHFFLNGQAKTAEHRTRTTSPINKRNENRRTTDRTSSPMGKPKPPNTEPRNVSDQQAQRKPLDDGPHFFPNGHDKNAERRTAPRTRSTSATKTAGQRTALLPQWARQIPPNAEPCPAPNQQAQQKTTGRRNTPLPRSAGHSKKPPDDGPRPRPRTKPVRGKHRIRSPGG